MPPAEGKIPADQLLGVPVLGDGGPPIKPAVKRVSELSRSAWGGFCKLFWRPALIAYLLYIISRVSLWRHILAAARGPMAVARAYFLKYAGQLWYLP